MNILGISCYFHDAAACLYRDGRVVAAASEERFSRKKHDPGFPVRAIESCLEAGRLIADDLDYVVFYDKPLQKLDRILTTYLATFPRSYRAFLRALPLWVKEKLWMPEVIEREAFFAGSVLYCEHHVSHAASAFLVSPFEEAALLTADGVGEWPTTTFGIGRGREIELQGEVRFPHSLGLLYSAFTYYLGFKVNSGEYKVMGLAPYGKPAYVDQVRQLIDVAEDGSFRMDMRYFAYHYGLRMTNERFHRLFGGPPREPESPLDERHCDIAASAQQVTEEVLLQTCRYLHRHTGLDRLCMAGGVGLNCVANGRILQETPFRELFVQPAAGDAGGALGAAAYVYHSVLGHPREWVMEHAAWGPDYSDEEIGLLLTHDGIPYRKLGRDELLRRTAELLEEGQVVGWFQGRMEFGPRALGHRSIIADPRRPDMRDKVNAKIKFRESFRPFAPSVLEDQAHEFFNLDHPSPFMLLVAPVREEKRGMLPAITHVDGSARLHTVRRELDPLYYDLIAAFRERTGCSVVLNTSFNVRGEPIVCTPRDALNCFRRSGIDSLVMGSYLVEKEKLPDDLPPPPEAPLEPD